MELPKEEKIRLQGWSIFSNIERPHAALIMRDPIDSQIKGVRYQVVPIYEDGRLQYYKFLFENWSYKARGPILHQTFLSFNIRNRSRYDAKVAKYVSDLKILNRHYDGNEQLVLSAVKCASAIIDHINFNKKFDVHHMLQTFGLIEQEEFVASSVKNNELEKRSNF